jgi:hypothetical protein
VLCFRDQHLDPDQQIAVTEPFGTLERHMARSRDTGNPLVHIVSNLCADLKPGGKVSSTGWYADKSFRPEPSLATIPHVQIMPPGGSETCSANLIDLPALDAEELGDMISENVPGVFQNGMCDVTTLSNQLFPPIVVRPNRKGSRR